VIPSSFIQDLLARTDVVDIVGRHVTLKKAGINYKGLCPFHGEKSPSFVVSPSRQTYHCFGCGVHGNAIGFLMEHAGLGFIDAVKELAQIQGMLLPEIEANPQDIAQAKAEKDHKEILNDVLEKAGKHWRQQLKQSPRAIDYLKGRGLSGSIAARFGIGYAPDGWRGLASVFPSYDDPLLEDSGLVIAKDDSEAGASAQDASEGGHVKRYDRFRDRIMFPIRSVQGRVIGFGGRVLDKGEPKYLNSPETPVFSKGKELYGLFEARTALRNKGYAIVTEGYMDVVALAQWGYDNAVATLGTACTEEHVQKLLRFTDQIIFSFDGDSAGKRAAGRALEASLAHASDTRTIKFLFLPTEHDPDSFIRTEGVEAFESQIQQAVPLSRQLLAHTSADTDLSSAEGRAKHLAQALPLVMRMPTGLLREQILQELAKQVGLSIEQLQQHMNQRAAESTPATDASRHTPGHAPEHAPMAPNRYRLRREGGGWGRQGQTRAPRMALQVASPLERLAWLLMHRSDLWEQLPGHVHDLLCEQAMPLGAFFSALDRITAEQGPMQATAIEATLTAPDVRDEAISTLLQRLRGMHAFISGEETIDDVMHLLRPTLLQSLSDELDMLLNSGELSPEAEARKHVLVNETRRLKLGVAPEAKH
jgi:DNA primase